MSVGLGPTANASPWVQNEGSLYSRLAVSSEEVNGLAATRTDIYGEYGLTDHWTITIKGEAVRFDDGSDFNNESLRITARRALFTVSGFVGALEGGYIEGGSLSNQNSCETVGLETRANLGWSGQAQGFTTFAFAEIAGRFHEDCERDRAEFGLGQEVSNNIWVISQAWFERGSDKAASDKVQTELLWRAGDIDLSVGYREEISGRFEEQSVFLAAVRRF
ncbi:MAG: hypothetical protein AAF613_07810 [Pseudomonadota bacterium]